MNYKERIKKRIIKNFIEENGYAPNMEQINELFIKEEKQLGNIEKFGFYGLESKKYNFQNESSSQIENNNREILKEDLEYQRYSSNKI